MLSSLGFPLLLDQNVESSDVAQMQEYMGLYVKACDVWYDHPQEWQDWPLSPTATSVRPVGLAALLEKKRSILYRHRVLCAAVNSCDVYAAMNAYDVYAVVNFCDVYAAVNACDAYVAINACDMYAAVNAYDVCTGYEYMLC
ncbi:hypothetical protein KSP40_PGU001630 [Platanthera guangdongensis]|uniref:Uncharacterized protein n=1 Tax=Platanthera guangdongensis TaxID=2320717 RepID=A0ABR2MLH1_9ASPA